MDNNLIGLIIFYLVVNLAAFFVMFVDKRKAKRPGAERISEGVLFFMATFFSSAGVFLGMFAFRHKTQKWHFLIGIPMLIVENCAFLYIFYQYILVNC